MTRPVAGWRRRCGSTLAFVVLVIWACDAPTRPPLPVAGDLAVRLSTPAGVEGAVLLRLGGAELPPPERLVSQLPDGGRLFARVSGNTLTVALFGTISDATTLFVFPVPDVAAAYPVTLLEVAGPDHRLRESLAAYSLTVERP